MYIGMPMTVEYDTVDQALLACVRGDPEDPAPAASLRRLSTDEWGEFVARCNAQRVAATVYARLGSAGLKREAPPAALKALRRGYINSSHRSLWLREATRSVVGACERAGIRLIVLKGTYLSSHVYADPALREMGDVDILVQKSRLGDALRVLQEIGFRSSTPLPEDVENRVTTAKHVPRLENDKAAIEVHWTIFPPSRGESSEIVGVWERAIPVTIARADTWALSAEDSLLHLCGHAAYDHRFQFGLRPLVDVDRLVRKAGDDIDWPTLVDRAGVWGWGRGVYLTFQLARELLGTRFPDDIVEALTPRTVTPRVLAGAAHLVLIDPTEARTLHLNIVDWQRGTLSERMRLLYERIRWSPEHVDPTPGYYVRRVVSLFRRHAPKLVRLLAKDRSTTRLADEKQALAKWLSEDESPAARRL